MGLLTDQRGANSISEVKFHDPCAFISGRSDPLQEKLKG